MIFENPTLLSLTQNFSYSMILRKCNKVQSNKSAKQSSEIRENWIGALLDRNNLKSAKNFDTLFQKKGCKGMESLPKT